MACLRRNKGLLEQSGDFPFENLTVVLAYAGKPKGLQVAVRAKHWK
jgi:hypothetical protein